MFQTSDMQLGYKQHQSTVSHVMCSLLDHKVITHYLFNGSNVYRCLLEASKAFDRVHFGAIFSIILNKNVSNCILRLLMAGYERQEARVKWNSCKHTYFTY